VGRQQEDVGMLTHSMPPAILYRRSAFQVALLMFATGGLYIFVWAYYVRRWCSATLEKQDQPRWKAIGLIVPFYNLFLLYEIGLLIRAVATRANLPQASWLLPWLGICYFLIGALWRLPDPYWFVCLLSFVPIAIAQVVVMNAQLALSGLDARPTKFFWAEWVVMILGSLMWIVAVLGTSLPDDAGKVAQPFWFSGGVLLASIVALCFIAGASRGAVAEATSWSLGRAT